MSGSRSTQGPIDKGAVKQLEISCKCFLSSWDTHILASMDFSADADLDSIHREATRLAARFDDDFWRDHDERAAFPWEFYRAFAEQGWLGVLIPTAYGGARGLACCKLVRCSTALPTAPGR